MSLNPNIQPSLLQDANDAAMQEASSCTITSIALCVLLSIMFDICEGPRQSKGRSKRPRAREYLTGPYKTLLVCVRAFV